MPGNIIDGKKIAAKIREGVGREVDALKSSGIKPRLVAVQVGEHPAGAVYSQQQRKHCEKSGISYEIKILDANISQKRLLFEIAKLNNDLSVSGIMLHLPLPKGMDVVQIQSSITPPKDVEGVNPFNMARIVYGEPLFIPCTALAVTEIIDSVGIDIEGKEAVIVGHSNIVGKPVALLLVNRLATVSMCHIATEKAGKLEYHVGRADILVVAVGKPHIIPGKWIKKGAVVVDVGINSLDGKIVGDVEFESAKERADFITPVPGGVGPVTTAVLLRNVVQAVKWARKG